MVAANEEAIIRVGGKALSYLSPSPLVPPPRFTIHTSNCLALFAVHSRKVLKCF